MAPAWAASARAVVDGDHQNSTAEVEAVLPEEVTGSSFRFRLTGIRAVTTNDWVSDSEVDQAVAIAEIGLPGPKVPELPERFDTGCRDDLLTIDGESEPVRATGPMSTVLAGDPVPLATCSGDPVVLGGGEHEIDTAPGDSSGLDIDQLVLRSTRAARPPRRGCHPGRASDGRRSRRAPTSPSTTRATTTAPSRSRVPSRASRSGWCWGRATTRGGPPPSTARAWASRRWSTASPTAG